MTPELAALWQEKIQPILLVFAEHVTIDDMERLRAEIRRDDEAPSSVTGIIDALYRLRLELRTYEQ